MKNEESMRSERADTIATQLTATGRGAIAVVSVRGPWAVEAVAGSFVPHSGRPLEQMPIGRIVLGLWHQRNATAPERALERSSVEGLERAGEDLVVCRVAEDTIEVHCHGGPVAVMRVLESLRSSGCRIVTGEEEGEEGEEAECLPGMLAAAGPAARAAWAALPKATTERTAAILLDQAHAALDAAILRIRAALAAANQPTPAALAAANQPTPAALLAANPLTPAAALAEVETLLRYASLGAHLLRPWRVVLVGEPNVGKSSLINAIVGFERAVVHAEAGTTRDVVRARTALDGWPVEFSDTAGLRRDAGKLEAEGIRRALAELEQADLLLLVRDVTRAESVMEVELPGGWQRPCLTVWNKADLQDAVVGTAGYRVSARTGQGLDELLAAIVKRLVPEVPGPGAAVPWTEEQTAWLEAAREALVSGRLGEVR